ncbi:MAG TPA: SMP-30/gluconolactonase/LRE family protein [Gaiellaceae bacterium]|nr:SMP-30/gluconolactonase/LRE family protein [Gaiellaceae bacterium]
MIETLVEGLDHPEGVCWDPAAGVLWAGGEAGQLYRVDLGRRRAEEVARAPGFVLGLAVDGRGRVVLCSTERGALYVLDDGAVRPVRDDLATPNSPAFAPDGTLYVSETGRWRAADGQILRLSPDGELDVFSTELRDFPNGCAVTADGRYLWIVESHVPTVNRFDLETGELERITRLEGTVPDGVAFTDDGGVLVSCYRPDRIVHLDPSGAVEVVAEDPQGTALSAPTNVAFAGPGLDVLVSANLGRWHLALVQTELRGVPLHYPDRWAADA